MPEIGTLKRVEQGSINIVSVETAPVNPMKVDIATIDTGEGQSTTASIQ